MSCSSSLLLRSMFGSAAASLMNAPEPAQPLGQEQNEAQRSTDLSDWTYDAPSDKALDLVFVRTEQII